MPRRSPFVIRLTEQERAELETRCKEYTSPYRDVVRARIVLLASEGLGNDRIAAPAGHATPDRQQVATAVLYRSAARSRRSTARRTTSALSPQCRGCDQGVGL
jgi:hypothetical protein